MGAPRAVSVGNQVQPICFGQLLGPERTGAVEVAVVSTAGQAGADAVDTARPWSIHGENCGVGCLVCCHGESSSAAQANRGNLLQWNRTF